MDLPSRSDPPSDDPLPLDYVKEVPAEPQSFEDIQGSKYEGLWREEMDRELHGLIANKTFSLVSKPPSRKAVGAKWVLKWKKDQNGNVVKAKARLVAKGFSQVQGIDYFDTFAPTPSTSSIRLLVCVALERDLDLYHFDADQAFVQSKLDTDIYMRMPEGCGDMSGKIVLLNKSLYGLKQAARSWHSLLVSTLRSLGFEQHPSEPCVLRLLDPKSNDTKVMIAVHVDDMIVAGNKLDCDWLRSALSEAFPVNNLGPLNWYTGCAFERNRRRGTIKIHQTAFIDSIINRFSVTTTRSTPADPNIVLRAKEAEEETADQQYRRLVGCLMWAANMSRPDISNAVREVARHAHNPSATHWTAARRILEYLKETRTLGLVFEKCYDYDLRLFADANFARNVDDRRSVTGSVLLCGKSLVSWISRTQQCVTLSTTEAEYVAMADSVKDALFVRNLLSFLVPGRTHKCITVREDNEGAISLANNPLSSARSRHIDVRHHFLREKVVDGTVRILHVRTADQHADGMTKPLEKKDFIIHRKFLMG